MALPAGLSTVTLTGGPYTDLAGAAKFAGMVGKLSLTSPLRYNGVEVDGTVTVTVAGDGTFSAGPLVNTSDPAVAAQGVRYVMDWQVGRFDDCPGGSRSVTFAVTAGASAVDFDVITPITTGTPTVPVSLPFVTSVQGKTGAVTLTAADVGGGSSAGVFVVDAVQPNGSAIQAALSACHAAGGGTVIIPPTPGGYTATAELTAYANTVIDARGATINLVGSAGRLLRNASLGGSGARDTDITVQGGTWTRDTTSADQHLFAFHRVDNVTVQDATFTTGHGKYAVLFCDATHFRALNIKLASVYSDGIHVQGPASNGIIDTVTGSSGDDLVAVGADDYPQYQLTAGGGNISGVTIRNLQATSTTGNICHIWASSAGPTVRNLLIDGVSGTTTRSAVSLDDAGAANDVDGVTIRNVQATVGNAYALVGIGGSAVKTVRIDGVTVSQSDVTVNGVLLGSSLVAQSVTVRNLTINSSLDHNGVLVQSGATVASLVIDGVSATMDPTRNSGTVLNLGASPGFAAITNVSQTNGWGLLYSNTGSPVTIQVANLYLNNVGNHFYAAGNGKITLVCGSVVAVGGTLLLAAAGTAAVDVSGGPFSSTATPIFQTATQAVRVNAPTFAVDLSKLTPADGDIVTNSNGSLSCGLGPVVYHAGGTGHGWKHLYTGATY